MQTRTLHLRWERLRGASTLVGTLSAAAVGMAAASNLKLAVALAACLVLLLLCALRSATILAVLIATVFVEALSIGGTHISRLVTPVALFLLIVAMMRGQARVRFDRPVAWVLAYALWATASLLWTVNTAATASQLASLAIAVVYMLAFSAWLTSRKELERTLGFLAVAACGVGAFAIFSYLTHASLDVKLGRASGGQGDPNFFAAYQVISIPVVLVLASEARQRWRRVLLYIAVAISIGSVLTTLSRGGLIALTTIVLLTLLLPSRTMFRSRRQKTGVVIAVLVVGAGAFQAVSGTFAPRLNSLLGQGGGSGRVVIWQGALTAARERPLTGIGFGAFQSVSDDLILRTPGVSLQYYDLPAHGQVVHNTYLGTAAELGIPGLLLFLGLLISTLRQLRRTAARARAAEALFLARVAGALAVGLIGWAVATIFLSAETSRPLWIAIGIALALPKLLESRLEQAPEPAPGSGPAAPQEWSGLPATGKAALSPPAA